MRISYWASSGNSWADILAGCRHAEATGWDGVWVPDHFMAPPGGYGPEDGADDSEMGPILEAWTMLGGLAAAVPRVRLGAMVSGNTYRHPAVLANMAATVDHISDGRLVLGLGAGWQENEHRRYGIPLGSPTVLSDRFEEACEVVKSLLTQPRTSFDGVYYQLDGAPCEPKPIQENLPLMIGGRGEKRTLRTVARFADEWNGWGPPEDMVHLKGVIEGHCADVGRDPAEIQLSAVGLLVFTDDEAATAKLQASMAHRGGLVGTVDQLRQRVRDYQEAGIDELLVPDFTMTPDNRNDMLDRFRTEVIEAL